MRDDLLSSLFSAMPELRTDIEMIVADVSIDESLAVMCQQGVVVLNCVGPVSVSSTLWKGGKQRKLMAPDTGGFKPTTL